MVTPHNAVAIIPPARNCQGFDEDLTPSRISNLSAIVVSKNGIKRRKGTYLECGRSAPAFMVWPPCQTILFLVADTSKAAAEPPHSKKEARQREPGFKRFVSPIPDLQLFLVRRCSLRSRVRREPGLNLACGVVHRKPRHDNNHAEEQPVHPQNGLAIAFHQRQ